MVDGADYAFRHSLMCEAVLAELLPFERRELHERVARALAETRADDVVTAAAVSMHWTAAGMPDEAAEWSLRAARKARSRGAFAESWGYYQRVLESPRRPATRPVAWSSPSRPRVPARLAGDPAAAAAALEEALQRAGGRGSRARGRAGAAGLLPLGGRADRAQPRRLRRGRPACSGPR